MYDVLVIGSLNMDYVVNIDSMPRLGETVSSCGFKMIPGGKGANQAYALSSLGVKTNMLGLVGNDENGKMLISNLKKARVNTKNIGRLKDVKTGCAFINVLNNGENSIVTVGGANKKVSKQLIDNNIGLIKNSKIIIMQLEIPIQIVLYVAKIAKLLGKIVVIDPAPAVNDIPEELYQYIDILKPNKTELATITGIELKNDDDVISAAKILIQKGVKNVIVTLGEKGSILVNESGVNKFNAIKVNVIDTTAAGDAFLAGVVKSMLMNNSLEKAIQFGHIVSSIVITKEGAQTSLPTEKELIEYMKRGNF